MTDSVDCPVHGSSAITFVCAHVAASLKDKKPRGFWYSSFKVEDEPCAWCTECEDMLRAAGDEWNDEIQKHAQIKLLCFGCFVRAAQLNGIEVPR
jgi:TPP-dependent indolepyruvate ferredoxin oxidoreductase alpha subunit